MLWVLTGASVDARSASINGLTIDTSSSAALARSAAAILTPRPFAERSQLGHLQRLAGHDH